MCTVAINCRLLIPLLLLYVGFFLDSGSPRSHGDTIPSTGVSGDRLQHIAEVFSNVPEEFNVHSCKYFFVSVFSSGAGEVGYFYTALRRVLSGRRGMLEKGVVDWAMGEAFAFGSLLEVTNYMEAE